MMISGILNIVYGLIGSMVLCCTLYGLICIWMPIIALVVGIFETMNGMKAQKGEIVPPLKTISIVGIVVGALSGNIIGLVLEILAIMNLGKEDAAAYLSGEA